MTYSTLCQNPQVTTFNSMAIAQSNYTAYNKRYSSVHPCAFLDSKFASAQSQIHINNSATAIFYSNHNAQWNHDFGRQSMGIMMHTQGFYASHFFVSQIYYSRRISVRSSLGSSLKYVHFSALKEASVSDMSMDVFGQYTSHNGTFMGLYVHNTVHSIGTLYQMTACSIGLSQELSPSFVAHSTARFSIQSEDNLEYGFGIEYQLVPPLALLMGIRPPSQLFTLGVDVQIQEDCHLSWAFESQWSRNSRIGIGMIWNY